MLNFVTATVNVGGNVTGTLNFPGTITNLMITGSITSTGVINAGAINTGTIGHDLAGLLDVTGLLGSLTVDGGTPGEIIAGNVNVITVLAGYGNSVFNLIQGGVQREILATPVAGGNLPGTVHFAFVYDSETASVPQVAIRVTDTHPVARSYNLALVVVNSSTAKFDLSRLDSYQNGMTGLSNISIWGDILVSVTAPETALFTDLTLSSRAGVVLPVDNITGVEVSGTLPVGFIDVAGLEGMAFGLITTATGTPVSVTTPLSQGSSVWNLLGSQATVNVANDAFVVPFNQNENVRLFLHDNSSNSNLDQVMILTDEAANNLPVTAYVQVAPSSSGSTSALLQSVNLVGTGGSFSSTLSVARLTTNGALGDVTISASAGSTVNNDPGLGNVTAASIFGSINVTSAGIYGVIQTTSGDLGQSTVSSSGQITSVTSIFANGAITGQIISRGSLISSVKTNGAFSGVIAAQGDIGAIQRNSSGQAVTNSSNALTRFGGVTIGGADSGQLVALGNVLGDITVGGTMTGRLAVAGKVISGLSATRFGMLGNITVGGFAQGAAIISGGLVGDATGGTTVDLGAAQGFVASAGAADLRATTIPAANLLQNQTGANLSEINDVFTSNGVALLFDTGGSLAGLTLIETELGEIQDNSGVLGGIV